MMICSVKELRDAAVELVSILLFIIAALVVLSYYCALLAKKILAYSITVTILGLFNILCMLDGDFAAEVS